MGKLQHEARHEINCVIHTHTWAGMALSALECGVLPITQTSMRFLKIGYHDYQGVVLDTKEEASLLADLGTGEALILRNHGLLTVGRTVEESVGWFVMAERVAEVHVKAPNGKAISDESAAIAASTLAPPEVGWRMFQWLRRSLLSGVVVD